LRTAVTSPDPRGAGARALARTAFSFGLLAAAACADQVPTAPSPAVRAMRAAPTTAVLAPQSSGPLSGIDCGCTRVGPYVNPAAGKTIAASTREGSSPTNVYQATVQYIPQVYVLRITRGGTVIRDLGVVPASAAWGFSQDDHRFVYHHVSGAAPNQVHNVYLYDLAAPGAPLVKEFHEPLRTSRVVFSPRGRHLLYARLAGASSTALTFVDGETGATRHDMAFPFQTVAGSGADSLGMAGWGFSPDDNDRAFAFRYVTGAASSQWNLVNLARGPGAALVLSETVLTSGFWQFSPCGDVLALTQQPNASQLTVRLVRALDGGTVVGSPRTLALGAVSFRSNLADHLVTLGGVDQPRLALNAADDACQSSIVPTLSAVSLNPATVRGGATSTCTVTLSGPAPAGGIVVTLASGIPGVASVPASVTVPAGSVSATAAVQTSAVTAPAVAVINAVAGTTRTATLTVNPPPIITIGPGSLSFANQPVGTPSGAQTVTLQNTGLVPLTIGGITTSGDFGRTTTCPIGPATLAPGASCTISVTFTPTAAGPRAGVLTITSDAPGSPNVIPLSGNGYVPTPGIDVASGMEFGSLTIGTTYSKQLRITSTGTGPLTISAVAIGGANTMDFYVASDGCTGAALSPGAYCTLMVGFDPTAAGARTATLTIAHNAAGGSSAVALSGTGVKPRGGYIP
jgi:hypothetical protein